MDIKDLQLILDGDVERINHVDARDTALYIDKIAVFPKKVKEVLRKYLRGVINAEELNAWAEFMSIRGEFCCPANPIAYENDEDYYEDMWNIIHYLATPEIDGSITRELVEQYLDDLDKYPDA